MAITLQDIQQAKERISPYVRKTPIQPVALPNGGQIQLKLENLQNTSAFKIRGAVNCILQLTEDEKRAGVVTGSSGNHAQGVACAAQMAGIKCTVFMPSSAPLAKVDAARAFGAHVELVDGLYNEACELAHALEREKGCVYIPAFDDPRIIAGQGTLALEILEQVPHAGQIITAIGGGGMISGVGIAAKTLRPDIKIIGVEPETAACMEPSVRLHELVMLEDAQTLADGVVTKIACQQTLEYCEAYVDAIVTVSERQIKEAILYLFDKAKIVSEGAGALPVAALLAGKAAPTADGSTVCVVSGGNIDKSRMADIIRELGF